MKKKKRDSHTVSTEWHELQTVAKKFGVKEWQVLKVMQDNSTNRRVVIEDWIIQNIINKKEYHENDSIPDPGPVPVVLPEGSAGTLASQ